jgi:hypothetical protein
MRIWLGEASNRLSFSSQTCQPSLARAMVIDLTTTLLSGRHIQPAQDWLPISIPHTYLIVASSEEAIDGVILIAHLLLPDLTIPVSITQCCLAPRKLASNPTNRGERQLMLDRQSGLDGS